MDDATIASPTASPTVTTTYTLTATHTNGCTDTDTVTVTVKSCDGIAPATLSADVAIHPNPSNGMVELQITNADFSAYSVELFNLKGQVVYAEKEVVKFQKQLNLAGLPTGVYHLRISTNSSELTKRLVIE